MCTFNFYYKLALCKTSYWGFLSIYGGVGHDHMHYKNKNISCEPTGYCTKIDEGDQWGSVDI